MLKHYVEFIFSGNFSNESIIKEIAERNLKLITVPERAVAFRFFDRSEIVVDGETLVGYRKNISPLTYFGTDYTLEEVKKYFPERTLLVTFMKFYEWNKVVKTCEGNWYLLEEGDMVIKS